jgi:hypothetical protein
MQLDHWVSDNNPSDYLQYRKGWWDYIEILRRLASKFDINHLEVVGTYKMGTPPPREVLLMPVVKLAAGATEFIVKYDFGTFPEAWTVSMKVATHRYQSMLGLFHPDADLRGKRIDGFDASMIFGPYAENPTQFTCEVEDEWDLVTLFRIVMSVNG